MGHFTAYRLPLFTLKSHFTAYLFSLKSHIYRLPLVILKAKAYYWGFIFILNFTAYRWGLITLLLLLLTAYRGGSYFNYCLKPLLLGPTAVFRF